MPIKPDLPTVDVHSKEAGTTAPTDAAVPTSTLPPVLPSPSPPAAAAAAPTAVNPFLAATGGQPPVQAGMGQPAPPPVQALPAAPPAYSSTPGIPLTAMSPGGGGGGGPPPPAYQMPSMQPTQKVPEPWASGAPLTGGALPPSYSDPFAPAPAPAPGNAFASGAGMMPTSAASPFGASPFDGGDPFANDPSSNGFMLPEPVVASGVDFPSNLPAHLGGPPPAAGGSSGGPPPVQQQGQWQSFD